MTRGRTQSRDLALAIAPIAPIALSLASRVLCLDLTVLAKRPPDIDLVLVEVTLFVSTDVSLAVAGIDEFSIRHASAPPCRASELVHCDGLERRR
jgi:hypothetical protein